MRTGSRDADPLPPEVRTLDAMLAHRARWSPDRLAFATGAEHLTYGQLANDAEHLASGLCDLGVVRGSRVGLFLPPGLDFVRVFYALQCLGAVSCAFEPKTPPVTAARRAGRLRPSLVLVAGEAADALWVACSEAGLHPRHLASVPRSSRAVPRTAVTEEEPASFQPTSGTSGEPRLAMTTHRNVLTFHRATRDAVDAGVYRILVSWAPPWHDLGLIRFVIGPVYLGSPCHLVTPGIQTLGTWLQTAAQVGCTQTGAPDFAYRLATRLVAPEGLDLSSLRCAINGGEPVRHSTIEAFEQRFGTPGAVRPGYGLAEATLGVTLLLPGESMRIDPHGNVSCGRPRSELEVRIDAPDGQPGEILMRGPAVFGGYFDEPEATAEVLRDGWLHSGDIGKLDDEGHLYVLGRQRALLKKGGVPLAPRELEEAAESVPGVRLSAALPIPASLTEATESIVVVVEMDREAPGAESALAVAVAAAVGRAVGFVPESVWVVGRRSIPRTPNGKVQHAALRKALLDGSLAKAGAVLARTERPDTI